ncbi:MAG: glucoamylase family protein [Bacillota bacterium]
MKALLVIILCLLLLPGLCCAGELSALDIANRNARFFADGVGVDADTGIPFDTIFVDKTTRAIKQDRYVNTTEIGEYLSILVLCERGIITIPNMSPQQALRRINSLLNCLWDAPNWKGLFYWPYNISADGALVPGEGGKVVPAVDNGNLSFALAGVAGAYLNDKSFSKSVICEKVELLLARQIPGWQALFDPKRQLLRAGWNPVNNADLGYYIDRKANESRLSVIWAIIATKDSSAPVPLAAMENMPLFTGEYTLANGKKLTAELTWDGTIFQALLPAIYINESKYISDYSLISNFVAAQADFANRHGLPALLSASSTIDDGYASFGLKELSESYVKFGNAAPPDDCGTPHASALAYLVNPKLSLQLLNDLYRKYPQIETPYGWYDAINAKGETGSKLLSLDQGMLVLALSGNDTANWVENYLNSKQLLPTLQAIYKSYRPQ